MDVLQLFFVATWFGLKLSTQDIITLLAATKSGADHCQPVTVSTLETLLMSSEAISFVSQHRDWAIQCEQAIKRFSAAGIKLITLGSLDYPKSLLNLSRPPLILSTLGRAELLKDSNHLTVIGSREPMTETKHWLQLTLNPLLQQRSLSVVSGGARGIDQLAHLMAISAGRSTICFQPAGLFELYPYDSKRVFDLIINNNGLIVSTYPPTMRMRKYHFIERNQLMAGIARGVLCAEANVHSGSMITARQALAMDIPVLSPPVSPLMGKGLGNLELIQWGATMGCSFQDLLLWVDRYFPETQRLIN